MQVFEDLRTLAEIAITLAGLTGIIGALHSRGGRSLSERESLHITNLLMATTIVVFLAFVPSTILLLPDGSLYQWGWSMRVLLVVNLVSWVIGLRDLKTFPKLVASLPDLERLVLSYFFIPIGVLATVAQAVVVAGYFPAYSAFVYQVVMMFYLAIGIFNFISLLLDRSGKSGEGAQSP